MSRVKSGITSVKKRNKVLKLAKGYFGAKHRVYRRAKEAVMKALNCAYIDRRRKKRDFRKIWIARINAAARINGMSYSKFMNGLKRANITLNRKMLADMAVKNGAEFSKIVEKIRSLEV